MTCEFTSGRGLHGTVNSQWGVSDRESDLQCMRVPDPDSNRVANNIQSNDILSLKFGGL